MNESDKPKSGKIISALIQGSAGFLISLILCVLIPMPGWVLLLNLSYLLEQHTGLSVDLVGEPQSIDPGALIVAILYGAIMLMTAFLILRKTRFSPLALSLAAFGILFSPMVFAFVSSIIWF